MGSVFCDNGEGGEEGFCDFWLIIASEDGDGADDDPWVAVVEAEEADAALVSAGVKSMSFSSLLGLDDMTGCRYVVFEVTFYCEVF